MITLPYSLVIEATDDPDFFGFYSPDLEGFTGIGHSVEDCLYNACWGMADHVETLRDQGLPVPAHNPNPTIMSAFPLRVFGTQDGCVAVFADL